MKNKSLIILLSVVGFFVALAIILGIFTLSSYNGLVDKRENVTGAHAEIETYLQRRADLIPNFVATVKGYSDYEQETLTAVTEARSSVSRASTVAEQQEASTQLDKAISVWVNAVTEAYPELKANEQYIALQDELAGTENRIANARNKYNKTAQSYNTSIKKFPRKIIAGMFGFDEADYFKAQEGTESVPQVSFD